MAKEKQDSMETMTIARAKYALSAVKSLAGRDGKLSPEEIKRLKSRMDEYANCLKELEVRNVGRKLLHPELDLDKVLSESERRVVLEHAPVQLVSFEGVKSRARQLPKPFVIKKAPKASPKTGFPKKGLPRLRPK